MTFQFSTLTGSYIDRQGRAICSQLSLLMGDRATGKATLKAASTDVVLPPNLYAIPIINGVARPRMPVKVKHNPATEQAHKQGGAWTVTAAGTEVDFQTFIGGEHGNVPGGSELIFDPPIAGLDPDAPIIVTEDAITGGTHGIVKDCVIYDDFPGTDQAKATFQGKLGAFPGLILAWMNSTPIEGRTLGIQQGATRKGRGIRAYFESWVLYVLASDATSGEARRASGLSIMEAARAALGDHHRNIDGEMLTNLGTGVEIVSAGRLPKVEQGRVFMINFRTVSVRKRVELREFNPWLTSRFRSFWQANPPANEEELDLHDVLISMEVD